MANANPTKSIIQCQVKLKLRPAQERMLMRWLWHLTGVYNWTLRTIEANAANRIYLSQRDIEARLVGHSKKLGIPLHVIRATALTAHDAWRRCFDRLSRKPKLKSLRNKLNAVIFTDPIKVRDDNSATLIGLGRVRFHAQDIPAGLIKRSQIVRRSSGWYLCLFIQAEPRAIPAVADGEVGIDPGFLSLLTLSTGEKVEHLRELAATATRLAQAQRGNDRRLTARLKEHEANQRKDRNHKLSRRLVSEHAAIYWSKDNHRAIARSFGRSVASAAHGQLRQMLAYKCRAGGRAFVEVSNRHSTVTCSACGTRSGPTGYAGLSVRSWVCGCGASHDRDVNAAINTLQAGRGSRLERIGNGSPEIAA